jgi:hypothetical protein
VRRVAQLCLQVPPMDFQQPLPGDHPQPQEERHFWFAGLLGRWGGHVEIGFLQHVGRVDAALQTTIETQPDHPPEPVAVARKGFCHRRRIAIANPLK